MITKEEFLTENNSKEGQDEIFCLIEEFLNRAKEKSLFNVKNHNCIVNGELVLTDTEKINIIKEMLI